MLFWVTVFIITTENQTRTDPQAVNYTISQWWGESLQNDIKFLETIISLSLPTPILLHSVGWPRIHNTVQAGPQAHGNPLPHLPKHWDKRFEWTHLDKKVLYTNHIKKSAPSLNCCALCLWPGPSPPTFAGKCCLLVCPCWSDKDCRHCHKEIHLLHPECLIKWQEEIYHFRFLVWSNMVWRWREQRDVSAADL